MQVPFGPYAPDLPSRTATPYVKNVLPKSKSRVGVTYGPLSSLQAVTDALVTRPYGAFAGRDASGNVATFVADNQDLFKLNGTSFDNVSKSSAAYSVAADGSAEFVQFGDRIIAALGVSDPLQNFTLGSSSAFADLAAAAPRARHIAAIKDFVMVGNTWDSTDGAVPNRVWWSGINNAANWPTIGSAAAASAQSDYQDLPVGGWVQHISPATGGVDGAIICEKAIYRLSFQGPPTIFGIYPIETNRGTPAENSCVSVGNLVFYLGEEGFYVFNGQQSIPIGDQKVDKTFFADLDQNYYYRIYGVADPINKMVFWSYPGSDNVGGRPNRLLIYNWAIGEWGYGEVDTEVLVNDLSAGYTLEGLDAVSASVDDLPFSLDSRIWTGGRIILSAFDGDNKLARFGGANLEALIDTQEFGGATRVFINGIRPYVESASDPTITVALRTRDKPAEALTTSAFSAVDDDGMAHFSKSTRYARGRIKIAAGNTWGHAEGVDYDATPDGDL
jgi:hypothetical protein